MPKISALAPTDFPSLLHWVAAAKDNETVRISIQQIRDLMQFSASEISAGVLSVEDVLTGLENDKADSSDMVSADNALADAINQILQSQSVRYDIAQTLSASEKIQARSNIKAPTADLRNVFNNPLFQINQRIVSGTVNLTAGSYGHDRLKAGSSGCTYNFSTNNGVTTINITAGSLKQVIESFSFSGRAGNYFLSWTGTAKGRIGTGSYGNSGAVSAVCDGSADVTVEFNAGTLSLVQFERDYTTDFVTKHIQQERAICQRYYCNTVGQIRGNLQGTSALFSSPIFWPQTMRTIPTVQFSGGNLSNATITGIFTTSVYGARLEVSGTSDFFAVGVNIAADAEI